MLNNEIDDDKCFFPICKESGCGGILGLKISEKEFDINYKCEKNSKHKANLYYKTFERFYLKTKSFQKCSKCSIILGNNSEYKCSQCKKFYCVNCYINDEHIKNDQSNLITSFKICKIHQKKLTDYCVNCEKEICVFCLKKNEENNPHKDHSIIYILNMMPSISEINSLKQRIVEKSKAYENLIISIDNC